MLQEGRKEKMNIFYNENGVGDVLLVQLALTRPESVTTKSLGDITLIHDEATKDLLHLTFSMHHHM